MCSPAISSNANMHLSTKTPKKKLKDGRMPRNEAETKRAVWGRDLRESRQVRVGEYVKRRKALENFVRELDVACRLRASEDPRDS